MHATAAPASSTKMATRRRSNAPSQQEQVEEKVRQSQQQPEPQQPLLNGSHHQASSSSSVGVPTTRSLTHRKNSDRNNNSNSSINNNNQEEANDTTTNNHHHHQIYGTQNTPLRNAIDAYQMMRYKSGRIVNNSKVQLFIVTLIALNAIMMGVGTYPFIKDNPQSVYIFDIVDDIFLIIFTLELFMQFVFHGWRLILNGWLVFDFIIIVSSWSFAEVQIIRAFRIFRALRLITRVKVMKNLVLGTYTYNHNRIVHSLLLSCLYSFVVLDTAHSHFTSLFFIFILHTHTLLLLLYFSYVQHSLVSCHACLPSDYYCYWFPIFLPSCLHNYSKTCTNAD